MYRAKFVSLKKLTHVIISQNICAAISVMALKQLFPFQGKWALAHLNRLQQDVMSVSNRCVSPGSTKYHRDLMSGSDVTQARCNGVDFQAHLHTSRNFINTAVQTSSGFSGLQQILGAVRKWVPGSRNVSADILVEPQFENRKHGNVTHKKQHRMVLYGKNEMTHNIIKTVTWFTPRHQHSTVTVFQPGCYVSVRVRFLEQQNSSTWETLSSSLQHMLNGITEYVYKTYTVWLIVVFSR